MVKEVTEVGSLYIVIESVKHAKISARRPPYLIAAVFDTKFEYFGVSKKFKIQGQNALDIISILINGWREAPLP